MQDSSDLQVTINQRMAQFADALLDPSVAIPAGVGKDNQPAPRRFAVYRNNVVVSLMEALGQAYPSIKAIMGEENFARVARHYVAAHPPRSAVMQQFGGEFSTFLNRFPPLANSPFLADIAIAERAWLDAWHAADHLALDPLELAGIEPEATMDLAFMPLPATRLIRSTFPICDLFDARNDWPKPDLNLDQAQNLLITRPGLECLVTPLDTTAADFAEDIFSGKTLGEAISNTMETDAGFDASASIAALLQAGALFSLRKNELNEF